MERDKISEEEIKIIEDFLNYNTNKQLSGVEINAISKLLNCYYKQQKEIEEKNITINKMAKDISIQLKEIEELKEYKWMYEGLCK